MKTIDVVIETPRGSGVKYDYDPASRFFKLAKILPGGMVFPFDFGFIPNTIGEDGDPIDVLVISEFQSITGCMISCRIIGCIEAKQKEKNRRQIRNDRFIAVPEVSLWYKNIININELPHDLLSQLQEFFITYNKIAGKVFTPLKILNAKAALQSLEKNRQQMI